jgi:hypothetical protein
LFGLKNDSADVTIKTKKQSSNKLKINTMAAKVYIVDYEHQANYKVFFVDYEHQQKNHQIIANGKLVNYEHEADCKVFIVNYEHQADIKIMRRNFAR